MEKLKPCPFCGGEAIPRQDSSGGWIECTKCGAQTVRYEDEPNSYGASRVTLYADERAVREYGEKGVEKAAKAWNSRHEFQKGERDVKS